MVQLWLNSSSSLNNPDGLYVSVAPINFVDFTYAKPGSAPVAGVLVNLSVVTAVQDAVLFSNGPKGKLWPGCKSVSGGICLSPNLNCTFACIVPPPPPPPPLIVDSAPASRQLALKIALPIGISLLLLLLWLAARHLRAAARARAEAAVEAEAWAAAAWAEQEAAVAAPGGKRGDALFRQAGLEPPAAAPPAPPAASASGRAAASAGVPARSARPPLPPPSAQPLPAWLREPPASAQSVAGAAIPWSAARAPQGGDASPFF